MTLAIVTATTDLRRAALCLRSWQHLVSTQIPIYLIANGTGASWDPAIATELQIPAMRAYVSAEYLGTVRAYRQGVEKALADGAEIIACLHDDFEIHQPGWDVLVTRHFERYPACGLAGFGGALGLGSDALYSTPYGPMQLARVGFRSNLIDAERHGLRSLLPEPVACLDGFSQIGRREFWLGQGLAPNLQNARDPDRYGGLRQWDAPWTYLEKLGVIHHGYDGMLGCLAKRYGWEVWYLPLRARHLGGQTAVGDAGYQAWAKTKHPDGDQGLWADAHRIWYDNFRDVLPIRV
jgi:hypothetical protein